MLKEYRPYKIVYTGLSFFILVISLLTISQYFFNLTYNIDNFFINDVYTTIYPGRMSEATALCFILIAISFIGIYYERSLFKILTPYSLLLLSLISFVSFTTHILQIPIENKAFFLSSMSIHTSVLFLGLCYAISKKNNSLMFISLLKGKHTGSKLLKLILPFVVLIPLMLSFVLLNYYKKSVIEADFGIVLYTFTLIIISIMYISYISIKLNKSDIERDELEKLLTTANQELRQFKYALDQSSIVVITNSKGIITYVNDTFCKISQYSRKELVGNTHKIINSGHHHKSFFKDL